MTTVPDLHSGSQSTSLSYLPNQPHLCSCGSVLSTQEGLSVPLRQTCLDDTLTLAAAAAHLQGVSRTCASSAARSLDVQLLAALFLSLQKNY